MSGRLEVIPGAGVVIRYGQICVWAGPQASSALLHFLGQSARNLGPSPRGGDLLAEHVISVLSASDPEPGAPFLTIGPDGRGDHVALLHGPVRLWDGGRWLEPPPSAGWCRLSVIAAPVLLAGATGAQPAPGGSHPVLDLESGAVPGGGFALVDTRTVVAAASAAPAPEASRPEVPAPEPAGSGAPTIVTAAPIRSEAPPEAALDPSNGFPGPDAPGDGTVAAFAVPAPDSAPQRAPGGVAGPDLTGEVAAGYDEPTSVMAVPGAEPTVAIPAPGRAAPTAGDHPRPPGVIGLLPPPGGLVPSPPVGPVGAVPVVRGVRCGRGHFNHPEVTACVRCGETIERGRRIPVSGPRPALGILVVDDGAIYALDRPYLIGARVETDPSVTGGSALALMLGGDRVADTHAEIRLTDWSATLVDRGSSGSTHVLVPGGAGWTVLAPFQQTVLPPGTHLAVGGRVLTFVSPWPP